MKVAGIIKNSVVNGTGIRDVVFLQGCNHRCVGCHNPETWNTEGGKDMTLEEIDNELKGSSNQITISGGEPMLQYDELIVWLSCINRWHGKRFWLYTGFKYEEIPPKMLRELARYVDVLVDGRFEIEKKDLTLRFRGSSNQRLIDLSKSLAYGRVKEWEDVNEITNKE